MPSVGRQRAKQFVQPAKPCSRNTFCTTRPQYSPFSNSVISEVLRRPSRRLSSQYGSLRFLLLFCHAPDLQNFLPPATIYRDNTRRTRERRENITWVFFFPFSLSDSRFNVASFVDIQCEESPGTSAHYKIVQHFFPGHPFNLAGGESIEGLSRSAAESSWT